MHHLVMPDEFSCPGINCEQAIAKEIRSGSIGAVEVIFRAGGRDEDDAALFIERQTAPGVRAPHGLPGVFGPGVVSKLAWMRNGMEYPDQAPGKNIVGTNVTGARLVFLVGRRTQDDQVFENAPRRTGLNQF